MVLGPTVAGGGPKLDAQPAWHALVVVRVFEAGVGLSEFVHRLAII
jgi:hypothetical protein